MIMKKLLARCFVVLGIFLYTACGQQQSQQTQATTKNDSVSGKDSIGKTVSTPGTIVFLSYNGTAIDKGNITGINTNEEFYLFMKNDKKSTVYVIPRYNIGLWSSKKIMPAELKPMTQTYKLDIGSSKKLENGDNTVEYFEITKLNSMVETDETE